MVEKNWLFQGTELLTHKEIPENHVWDKRKGPYIIVRGTKWRVNAVMLWMNMSQTLAVLKLLLGSTEKMLAAPKSNRSIGIGAYTHIYIYVCVCVCVRGPSTEKKIEACKLLQATYSGRFSMYSIRKIELTFDGICAATRSIFILWHFKFSFLRAIQYWGTNNWGRDCLTLFSDLIWYGKDNCIGVWDK